MKKFNLLFVFIILICITILSGCTKPEKQDVVLKSHNTETTDTSWETIKEKGVINIGIAVDGLPYIEKKTNGKYNGYLKDANYNALAFAGVQYKAFPNALDDTSCILVTVG